MGIRLTTPQQEIEAYIEKRLKRMQHAVIRILEYAGEQCITIQKERHKYKNQTANLESSTGYLIINNGRIIKKSFDFTTGGTQGKKAAEELIAKYASGLVLIIVAGMKYAVYVSDKGLDVLDSAEIEAQNILPQLLNQLSV